VQWPTQPNRLKSRSFVSPSLPQCSDNAGKVSDPKNLLWHELRSDACPEAPPDGSNFTVISIYPKINPNPALTMDHDARIGKQ